jgi:hypothetical protein
LSVGEIQSHHIQANDPSAKRLVTPLENSVSQVIELAMAASALVSLPSSLRRMKAAFGDFR